MLALDSEECCCFPEIMKYVEEDKWTGVLDVVKGMEQFGTVFIFQGHIAWATSKAQSKNLGFYLEKIGNIPKEKQKEIFDKLKAFGKNMDLGTAIEETGLISRAKLRDCLRGHINAAILSFIEDADLLFRQKEGCITASPDLLFSFDEILQYDEVPEQPFMEDNSTLFPDLNSSEELTGQSDLLENLANLTGYQYSFICNSEGKVLASHKSDSLPCKIDELLPSSTSWVVSSASSLRDLNIGRMEFVLVEHEKGSLIARCHTGQNIFIAASFDEMGKPGVIKHKISEITPFISQNAG